MPEQVCSIQLIMFRPNLTKNGLPGNLSVQDCNCQSKKSLEQSVPKNLRSAKTKFAYFFIPQN